MANLSLRTALGPAQLACETIFPKPLNSSAVKSNLYITHGLLGNSKNWITAARRLVQHPLLLEKVNSALALDMRNHGRSPHFPIHDNAALASDLEGVILNAQRSMNSGNDKVAQHSVLIAHSMGGLAAMGVLLRRYNEKAIFDDFALKKKGGREDSAVSFGKWGSAQRQECAAAMEAVNEAFGFAQNESLRDVLFYDPNAVEEEKSVFSFFSRASSSSSSLPLHGRISACVIVDVTPTVPLDKNIESNDGVFRTLDCMMRVNLSAIQNYSDAQKELIRVGIMDKGMRDFITTNIVLNSNEKGGAASWRCNLPVLSNSYGEFAPDIVRWFDNNDVVEGKSRNDIAPRPCTLPILFVFGGNSPFNDPVQRKWLRKFFPNAQEVEVGGAGHFVHYEKMEAFVETTAPFIAEHLQSRE